MPLTKKTWIVYLALSVIAFILWLRLGYPEFSFVDLSIGKTQALKIAQDYLSSQGITPQEYRYAIILQTNDSADRYLQKTLGFQGEIAFLKEYKLNLFLWVIRFFQEGEKEEYVVVVDTSDGKIVSYRHILEETAAREELPLDDAYHQAKTFLTQAFSVRFDDYMPKEKTTKKYDNRTDHSFSWQHNNVSIPWSEKSNAGTAKLLIRAKVSGQDILSFDAASLDIPDEFNRSIERSTQSGRILTGIFLVFYYGLIMAATYLVVIKRHHLIMQISKKFYILLALILFIMIILFYINNIPDILFDYPTTSTLSVFFSEMSLGLLAAGTFSAIAIILPGIAGESLTSELKHKGQGFVSYIQSTFRSRKVTGLIVLGYFIAMMMLGLQSLLFHIGRTYCHVWTERFQVAQASSSLWPFLTVLAISFRAGVSEEIFFRLFGISWGEKILKNVFIACFLTSIVWGFGHTHYPIFPAWFRGLEVACLGLLLSFFYLRYGIIPVIVGHFLFDAFWGCAGFLLGKAQAFDFYTCLLVLGLPLLLGLISFVANRPDIEKTHGVILGKIQIFNLNILKYFLADPQNRAGKTADDLRQDLIRHGWDGVVVDEALKLTAKNKIAN